MSIIADRIEQFILQKLLEEQKEAQKRIIILQRNELADELDCAPSQISYVLSTRFSNDRGYIVESRRGLGGYIRVMQVAPLKIEVPPQGEGQNDDNLSLPYMDQILYEYLENKVITKREAQLLHEMIAIILEQDLSRRKKVNLLQRLLRRLETL